MGEGPRGAPQPEAPAVSQARSRGRRVHARANGLGYPQVGHRGGAQVPPAAAPSPPLRTEEGGRGTRVSSDPGGAKARTGGLRIPRGLKPPPRRSARFCRRRRRRRRRVRFLRGRSGLRLRHSHPAWTAVHVSTTECVSTQSREALGPLGAVVRCAQALKAHGGLMDSNGEQCLVPLLPRPLLLETQAGSTAASLRAPRRTQGPMVPTRAGWPKASKQPASAQGTKAQRFSLPVSHHRRGTSSCRFPSPSQPIVLFLETAKDALVLNRSPDWPLTPPALASKVLELQACIGLKSVALWERTCTVSKGCQSKQRSTQTTNHGVRSPGTGVTDSCELPYGC
ncbi:uncharacterized protein LOC121141083 [Mesocricetus auratus]|uniref:Uncharacterized protein LOC121141083 n=1 Tax=Mesocricetus auratus TaxID=10036 RepID=A0ABM2XMA6_MESAU|nr:uncharacterized protein LOC121141083 [Mesocricetus auratus]